MKVGIELLSPLPGKCGAVSNLWRNYLSLFPLVDKSIEYIVFLQQQLCDYYRANIQLHPNLKFHVCNVNGRSSLNRIQFQEMMIPQLLKKYQCDLLFTSSPTPTLKPIDQIEIFKITGSQFYSRPREFGLLRSFYHYLSTSRKSKRSKHIIVNSHYLKRQLMNKIGVPPDRLKVIYESLDHHIFNTQKPIAECKNFIYQHWGISSKYLLYISDLRPYKNPMSLIQAFNWLGDKVKDYRLIMIGQDVAGYKNQLIEYIDRKNLSQRVIMFDFMEPFHFVYLMRAAEIFIYPSSLETFGTIPLEAMACGTPVIAGNETAIPEICGDAALLVDGKNYVQLAQAILTILSNAELKARLIEKGLAHVKSFSWDKNVAETVALFRQAAANPF